MGLGVPRAGAVNLNIPFEAVNTFSDNEKVSKIISIMLLFVREYRKFFMLTLTTTKETILRLRT